ncbi:hypothetical protein NDU88_003737 [Pleurodeles waltl]|uniref:Uncharacterized protein n=1 Tax=Pleurodeles waltl TaxID=8319 RepID=A0AAV7RJE7_PLEWA|nr:hypothetical protein NDU88_003737 [Pleurodeles waltl]
MPPRTRPCDRVLTRVGTPTSTEAETARESGGNFGARRPRNTEEARLPNVEELRMEKLDDEGQTLLEDEFLEDKVAQAISKSNKEKAAGPGGLPAEFYVKLRGV